MDNMHTRLREARERAGFKSSASAARAMGVTTSTYTAHENGQNKYGPDEAKLYGRRFHVRPGWLLTGEHEETELVQRSNESRLEGQPTIGTVTGVRGIPIDASGQLDVTAGLGAGGLTIVSDGVPGKRGMTFAAEHVRDYWRLPADLVRSLGLRAHDIVVIPVQGDSMSPTLLEDDYVFIDTRHRTPSPDGLYALLDDFGGIVVKRIELATTSARSEDAKLRVISDNPRHEPKERPLDEVRIVGRVVRRFGVVS